jgi:serine/threonine protein kinase
MEEGLHMQAWLEYVDPAWKDDVTLKLPIVSMFKLKFRMGTKLAKGHFGSVFPAYSTGLGETKAVAVKMIELKRTNDVKWVASEMQILLTVTGHRNVILFKEAYYSWGMTVLCSQVAGLFKDS